MYVYVQVNHFQMIYFEMDPLQYVAFCVQTPNIDKLIFTVKGFSLSVLFFLRNN